MSLLINEVGKTYGYLTVIERAQSKDGRAYWRCLCSCGKEVNVSGTNLRKGQQSCGCIKKEKMKLVGQSNAIDITNQTFNYLTAISKVGSASYGGVLWLCQCRCGNTHIVEYSNLITGKVKSCGCLTSVGEATIQQLLNNFQINYQTQYYELDWKLSSGYHPYFDFAIFNKDNQLIGLLEYHGEQHKKYYINKTTWNNKENFLKTQQRDSEKENLCKNLNIPLGIIWYSDDIEKTLKKYLMDIGIKNL